MEEAIFSTWWHQALLLLQETGMMTYILQCHLLALYLIVNSSQISTFNVLTRTGVWKFILFSFPWLGTEKLESGLLMTTALVPPVTFMSYLRDAAYVFQWQEWLSYLKGIFHLGGSNFFHFIHKTFTLASISYTNYTVKIFFNQWTRCPRYSNSQGISLNLFAYKNSESTSNYN